MPVHIEKIFPCNIIPPEPEQRIFLRLNLDQEAPDWVKVAMPMLHAPAPELNAKYWNESFFAELTKAHIKAAEQLKHAGFNTCVIAADSDGCLHKALSPRFSPSSIDERMSPLLTIYQALAHIMDEVWVLLTIEELAPGGFDASDGVLVAQRLEAMGLENLIVASGTRDFLPLYDRRPTQKKSPEQADFCSHEPGLASTIWALEHTHLKVWWLGFIQDHLHAMALARELGLAGIIDKKGH